MANLSVKHIWTVLDYMCIIYPVISGLQYANVPIKQTKCYSSQNPVRSEIIGI